MSAIEELRNLIEQDGTKEIQELLDRAQTALSAVVRLSAQAEKVGKKVKNVKLDRSFLRKLDKMEGDLSGFRTEMETVISQL